MDSEYESEQNGRFKLALCELHNPMFHGGSYENDCDKEMCGHFLYTMTINMNCPFWNRLKESRTMAWMIKVYEIGGINAIIHPTIRNYKHMIYNQLFVLPQIVEKINGPNEYTSAIIKTHYLRLIQRKWKSIYAERRKIIAFRKNPKAINHRKIYGVWPQHCRYFI